MNIRILIAATIIASSLSLSLSSCNQGGCGCSKEEVIKYTRS
ncbi:MAG: hypothetical protein RR293_08465 [Bacteroidales bacterium]